MRKVACRIEPAFTASSIPIHPSILHPHHAHCVQSISGKEKRERGGRSCRCIFYAFRGLHTLARIYILTSSDASVSTFHIIPVSPYLSFILFFPSFFGLLKPNVNIDWPHTLPVHWLSLLFSDLYALRSPLHAYHSLLVWPLYQQREHLHLPTSRASHGK